MTTINPAISFGQTQGDLGLSYVFAEAAILVELQDQLNAMDLGVVPLWGDFQGTGTDTIRVTHMGSIGWSASMTALGSETDSITPSAITTGYVSVTLGMYGISHSETYKQQVLSRERGVSVDNLKSLVPATWLRTWRQQLCSTGAAFSPAVGASTTQLSVDDYLDLSAAYRNTRGAKKPTVFMDGHQMTQLVESFRQEPAFQTSVQAFQATQAFSDLSIFRDFVGMGMDVGITNDVTQSGGAYQGFAFSAGGVGWAVASTSPIVPANPQGAIYVPEYGLFIEEITSGSGQATRKYEARAFFGLAAGSTAVFVQRRLISKV